MTAGAYIIDKDGNLQPDLTDRAMAGRQPTHTTAAAEKTEVDEDAEN